VAFSVILYFNEPVFFIEIVNMFTVLISIYVPLLIMHQF